MSENCYDNLKEAVCVQTKQVYDSCKCKECVEDLRVYICESSQSTVDCAGGLKISDAEILWVTSDVEPAEYSKGFYTVELKYYISVKLKQTGVCHDTECIRGLAVYCKKIVLFGSCGSAKIFTSQYNPDGCDYEFFKKTNLPEAVVEVVDPVPLSAKVVDGGCGCECEMPEIPEGVRKSFQEDFHRGDKERKVYVTLGLFTIVKLQRNSQLLIPAYDFCIPDKECTVAKETDPCEMFGDMKFPVDEFFPPVNTSDDDCNCKKSIE